ncbi:MAG: response regulator [Proteobacteria bacterium]|nr:response regulator [Pseudomonadota bacterium]MBU1717376.1 response regulator [Pseudomonadota bacterium]
MTKFINTTFDLLSQFTGGRGGIDNIVPFGIAALSWGVLLLLAWNRQTNENHPHEKMLLWGFSFALGREIFMIIMACLNAYSIIPAATLHVIFPPLDHAIFDIAVILVAAAFLRYLLPSPTISSHYLKVGVATVLICFLATFWWWGNFIWSNPSSQFGQTWCDWLFRINASLLLGYPIYVLLIKTKGLLRNTICLALLFIFLNQFLKIPDMYWGEVYENIFTPIRHGLYLLAIPLFGFVYIHNQSEEQKTAEDALQRSEFLYRSLVENINLGVTLMDVDHNIIMANTARAAMFNKLPGEIKGKKCFIEFGRNDKPCQECPGKTAMATGLPQEKISEGVWANGEPYKLAVKAFPVIGPENEATGFIEVIEDITERQNLQDILQRSEKLESISMLAGGIAHDFNNLLTGILANISLVAQQIEKGSKKEQQLANAEKAAERAQELTHQLLTFSKRKETLEKETASIEDIIRDSAEFSLRGSNVKCIYHFQEDIWPVKASSGQIEQVIQNIIINADQAMPNGGEITIHAENVEISAESTLPLIRGNYLRIKITDQGGGIPEEYISKIYDPYFSTKGGGSGLGLSICYSIIQSHDGFITVDSIPGKGSTFTIYLPADSAHAVSAQNKKAEEPPKGSGTILLMDDEEVVRDSVAAGLKHFGYQVEIARDGNEALEIYHKAVETKKPFAAIVLDLTIPGGMGGKETLNKILSIDPGVKAIVSSGYSEDPTMVNFRHYGFVGVALKPYKLKKLHEIIQEAIR